MSRKGQGSVRAAGQVVVVAGAALVLGCGTVSSATSSQVLRGTPPGVDREVRDLERVVDGDTLRLVGGERVRVLGIDACETSTSPAGRVATDAARSFLGEGPVTLSAEPGIDRDRYGRLLRYVADRDGDDLGEHMVSFPHTGVYEGANDASPGYLARLRARDTGRECASGS